MSAAPRTTPLTIVGPAGPLEGMLEEPADTTAVEHLAVVCHPHPLYGGTMTNKVVHILARAFNELGAPALRFNFRGVGRSSGTHDDGRGETDDTLAVIQWAEARWSDANVWLAGFSFGAAMALRASLSHSVSRLVTVAPALRWLTSTTHVPNCPWLIVQGDRDELVDVNAVREWVANLQRPPHLHIVPGGEHFFHGRLNEVRDIVKSWLLEK